jgi:hypothetical protein
LDGHVHILTANDPINNGTPGYFPSAGELHRLYVSQGQALGAQILTNDNFDTGVLTPWTNEGTGTSWVADAGQQAAEVTLAVNGEDSKELRQNFTAQRAGKYRLRLRSFLAGGSGTRDVAVTVKLYDTSTLVATAATYNETAIGIGAVATHDFTVYASASFNRIEIEVVRVSGTGSIDFNLGSAHLWPYVMGSTNSIWYWNGSAYVMTSREDDVCVESDKAFYLGDKDTDGSWRITRSGDNLVMQQRESSVWVTKSTING